MPIGRPAEDNCGAESIQCYFFSDRIVTDRQLPADRLLFLDGLRALAALWVMLGHLRLFPLGWTAWEGWAAAPLNALMYMHYGVDVFLVLSGFCLALPLVRGDGTYRGGLKGFFAARAARILPPYFATLALILLVNTFVPIVRWARHDLGLTGDMPWQVLWTNLLLMQDIYPQYNNVNGPFWSVATEWHLYAVFPLLIWVWRRHGVAALLAAGTVAAVALTALSDAFPRIPVIDASVPQPPYYVVLLVQGIAAAALAFSPRFESVRAMLRKGAWLAALLLVVAIGAAFHAYPIVDVPSVLRHNAMFRWFDPLAGALTAALLVGLAGVAPTQPLRRLLESSALVKVGGFSYSLYLIHIPLLTALYGATLLLVEEPLTRFLLLLAAGVPVCLIGAWMFSRVFERRFGPRARPAHPAAQVQQVRAGEPVPSGPSSRPG